jgi:5-methylcytosine-specific restriction endonuclease McrA
MNKVCTKCGKSNPLEDYYKHSLAKDGRASKCKSCHKLAQAKYAKSDKGRLVNVKAHVKYDKTEKGKATTAKYFKTDKGKLAIAKYNKTSRGKLTKARTNHNRRINIANTKNNFTIKESKLILFLQNYQCANPNCECGRFFDMVEPTLDHIVPVELSGDLIKENVQYLCQSCNSSKGIKYIDYRSETHKQMIERI